MGLFDKIANLIDVNDSKEDEEYEDNYNSEDAYEQPSEMTGQNDKFEEPRHTLTRSSIYKTKKLQTGEGASVCVFKPVSVTEAREITMTLKANKTVVLNLEDADDLTAQRILDFTSGSCFALDGNLQKISNYIFMVTPASVDITGDLQDTIAESFGG